jgi:hypothetical protein
MELAQDCVQWPALVSAVSNLRVLLPQCQSVSQSVSDTEYAHFNVILKAILNVERSSVTLSIKLRMCKLHLFLYHESVLDSGDET